MDQNPKQEKPNNSKKNKKKQKYLERLDSPEHSTEEEEEEELRGRWRREEEQAEASRSQAHADADADADAGAAVEAVEGSWQHLGRCHTEEEGHFVDAGCGGVQLELGLLCFSLLGSC